MAKLSRKRQLAYSAAIVLSVVSFQPVQAASTKSENAWTAIESDPQFSDAVALFKYAGLTQYVQTGHFTAFIPTNAAFNKNPEVLPTLMPGRGRAFPDTTAAVTFVRSHAIFDLHPLSEFAGRSEKLTAISGYPISVDGSRSGVYTVTWTSLQNKTGTAQVVDKPIVTANALIYPVDTVVLADQQEN